MITAIQPDPQEQIDELYRHKLVAIRKLSRNK